MEVDSPSAPLESRMRKIRRSEILDRDAYALVRDELRAKSQGAQANRRVDVGEHMSFVFADRDSLLLDLHDLLHADGITRESVVLHEIEEANERVPDEGELSAKLLIEIVDRDERRRMLQALEGLDEEVVLHIGPRVVRGVFRALPGQASGRVSTINYVRFPAGSDAALLLRDETHVVTLEVTHAAYDHKVEIPWPTRFALAEDLVESE